ncbi:MAG: tetratricopeptide repeat protein [Deltaproteobacteria bacterium]|nr:tetratricopeptide repeat protein [Deltaproteobacteria bacterium]
MNPQTGRNDPCPCGSGLKYKKCCLNQDVPRPQTEPDNPEQVRTHALKLISEKKWDEAIRNLKAIEQTHPRPHLVFEALAASHEAIDDYLKASEYYEKALGAAPEHRKGELFVRLGASRACAGRIEKAFQAFENALTHIEKPEEKAHITQMSLILERIERGEENPYFFLIQAELQRAFSDMEEEDYRSAAARLERIQSLDPEDPVILYNLGVVYTFLKREKEALASFERTVQNEPGYVQAWYNMGQIYLILEKDFSRALNCFDKAATLRPDYVSAHHQKGVAWELLGDLNKAVAAWQKTLELDPRNKQALGNIERVSAAPESGTAPIR